MIKEGQRGAALFSEDRFLYDLGSCSPGFYSGPSIFTFVNQMYLSEDKRCSGVNFRLRHDDECLYYKQLSVKTPGRMWRALTQDSLGQKREIQPTDQEMTQSGMTIGVKLTVPRTD